MRIAFAITLAITAPAAAEAADRKPPYWASINAGQAYMRTGPAKTYPIMYLYKRAGLPIRVVGTYPGWRKVREPDGTTGWMQVSLLQDTRTAIVSAGPVRAMRRSPADNAKVSFQVQPGVVGLLSRCMGGWCRIDVNGRAGYIRTSEIWGVDPQEELD